LLGAESKSATHRRDVSAGSAGSGKTLMAIEFLVYGTLESGKPGVFMSAAYHCIV
jgi:hypothetical protein